MGTKVQSKSFVPGGFQFYNEKALTNDQIYNGFFPSLVNSSYPGYDKDSVKQKMLEHEAVFKNQVCELHRLYRVQRDMMNGAVLQRKELRGNESRFGSRNGFRSDDAEVSESRPSKVRRKTFDLQLPADEFIDTWKNGVKICCDRKNIEDRSNDFADLNELVRVGDVRETDAFSSLKFLDKRISDSDRSVKKPSSSQVLGFSNQTSLSSYGREVNAQSDSHLHENGNENEWLSCVPEDGERKSQLQFPLSLKQTRVSTSKSHEPIFYQQEETVFGAAISVRPCYNVTPLGVSSPEPAKPWLHTLEKRSNTFGNKTASVQANGAPDWFLGSNAAFKPEFTAGFFQGFEEQPSRISSNDGDPGLLTSKASNNVDMNLNKMVSQCVSAREIPERGLEKKSDEDRRSVLPWLRPPNPVCQNEAVEFEPIETSFSQSPLSRSPNSTIDNAKDCGRKSNLSDSQSSNYKKLLSFPILESPSAYEKSQAMVEKARTVLDMNLPCEQTDEESAVLAKVTDVESATSFRHHIDLNSCLSNGEDKEEEKVYSKPSSAPTTIERLVTEIDLESPPEPEEEEEEEEEAKRIAAEAIVSISTSFSRQKLEWLAEIVLSLDDDDVASGSAESDFFEMMTLNLAETNEFLRELVGPALQVGPGRKGGRRRRDFQRDILPGLASLSRHDVTEDLQLFGGLLRAPGRPRPAKRGRSKAGPARAILLEAGPGSLTGWGKTTRRPRRHRCPSGNPTLVVIN